MNPHAMKPRRPLRGWRVVTLTDHEAARARQRRRTMRAAAGWIVLCAVALLCGHLFAVGIGGRP